LHLDSCWKVRFGCLCWLDTAISTAVCYESVLLFALWNPKSSLLRNAWLRLQRFGFLSSHCGFDLKCFPQPFDLVRAPVSIHQGWYISK
jgi:hypothetical protein